jgi:hypothetical protein
MTARGASVNAGLHLPLTGVGHGGTAGELQVLDAVDASFGRTAGDSGQLAVEPAATGENQYGQEEGECFHVTFTSPVTKPNSACKPASAIASVRLSPRPSPGKPIPLKCGGSHLFLIAFRRNPPTIHFICAAGCPT